MRSAKVFGLTPDARCRKAARESGFFVGRLGERFGLQRPHFNLAEAHEAAAKLQAYEALC